jgi:glyoxylase-like metal-dependent hydrolase (beta-lactamase superfamily II)
MIVGSETFHFQLGAFKCTVVNDGNNPYSDPAQVFFANASEEQPREALREHNIDVLNWKEYNSPYPSLFIDAGQHQVLTDTSEGNLEPTAGKLIPNLRAEGIMPVDIGTVIFTHAHPDHIGGNINEEGKPTFPNARYVTFNDEWVFGFRSQTLQHWTSMRETRD